MLFFCFTAIVLGILMGMHAFGAGLSLNNRVDRQRDFLCAKYADADAALRDCPRDTLPERIKALETELERLRAKETP